MNDITNSDHEQWRAEIGFLGSVLGETIREQVGQESFELVEKVRRLSWLRREGDTTAESELDEVFAQLDETQIRVVIRAFTIFLDLLNLVEDGTRKQVLRQRSDASLPATRAESIGQALATLKDENVSAEAANELLESLSIELVFTAHPTEAKRRSVRRKLREIRNLLASYHEERFEYRKSQIHDAICRELALLWQTNFIRPWRPSVMQEVERGLSIKSVLWDVIPQIEDEIRREYFNVYGVEAKLSSSPITFGSWIGGDRDGHPGVTSDVTKETLQWLRKEAVKNHLATCDRLFETFTVSSRQVDFGIQIQTEIDLELKKNPELESLIAPVPPGEQVRRYLAIMRCKLAGTLEQVEGTSDGHMAYRDASSLRTDLQVLVDAIGHSPHPARTIAPLLAWQSQVETFGFHLAKLDVRQNSSVYKKVVDELLVHLELSQDPSALDENARCELLGGDVPSLNRDHAFSDETNEVIELFSVLHDHAATEGLDAMGAQIVSMTNCASDILSVAWLWKLTQPSGKEASPNSLRVPPLVPLLETVDDLKNGPDILELLFSAPEYRSQLAQQSDRQVIMLGYSDSTKDGGYLAACWALHECQRALAEVAQRYGVSLTFFHGRGGSLGRGGGPAARAVLSLPQSTFDGTIRITEQGEVLAERYDDPEIAHRHLEQMVWSSTLAAGVPGTGLQDIWISDMECLASNSRKAYRELVQHPQFVRFFRKVTPISDIEQLPIGSRPSRRKPDGGLDDLRAIPWVFSWTQCRCLLPAWYGMGTAIEKLVAEREGLGRLWSMYRDWPFFRATIDNAELALAKADEDMMGEYFRLGSDDSSLNEITSFVHDECKRAKKAILKITGNADLLSGTEWLRESIRVRNRFIDPLNLLQVEMMRRWNGEDSSDDEEHRHLKRLAINGVASGMRTSG